MRIVLFQNVTNVFQNMGNLIMTPVDRIISGDKSREHMQYDTILLYLGFTG